MAESVPGKTGRVRSDYLSFSPPTIGEEEIAEVSDTLRSGWISRGPKTEAFEKAFADFLGGEVATLAVNSCTAALHLSLVSIGVGPGDEVITTPLTFASCVNVIEHVGATPVLVDIDPQSLLVDLEKVRLAITPRTKAILAVHYSGQPLDLDELRAIESDYGVAVIEDAAHALPATFKGRLIGSSGHPAAFSFYATKNLTTGEGGMLAASPDVIERARILSLHGMSRDAWRRYERGSAWKYEVLAPGFKYNMNDIQASLGLCQLRRLHEFQDERSRVVRAYEERFGEDADVLGALELPRTLPDREHAWHLYAIRLRLERLSIDRDDFIRELDQRNIGTSVHFIPIHLHPYYAQKYGYVPTDFPDALREYQRLISLPLHPGLTHDDIDDVVHAVSDVVQKHLR